MKYNGSGTLPNGLTFQWMISGRDHKEIYGWVERPNGDTIQGSAGWYRTTDPEEAAQSAALAIAPEKDRVRHCDQCGDLIPEDRRLYKRGTETFCATCWDQWLYEERQAFADGMGEANDG